MNKLVRTTKTDCQLSGVCGGIAKFFGIDSTAVRVIFAISTLVFGVGPLIYLALWIIVPSETENPRF